jgi:hypothetical protein
MEAWMPVTAKLSRAFYDRFGDDVTNELVGLLNIMDSTYLTELRHLNEQNSARYEARMDQRFAESDARLEKRFAESDAKFAELRVWLEGRFAGMEARFAESDVRMERRLGEIMQRQLVWIVGLFIAGVAGVGSLVLR